MLKWTVVSGNGQRRKICILLQQKTGAGCSAEQIPETHKNSN